MPRLQLLAPSGRETVGRGGAILLALLPPGTAAAVIFGVRPVSLGLLGVFYLTVLFGAHRSPWSSRRSLLLLAVLALTVLLPMLLHGIVQGDPFPSIWFHTLAVLLVAALGWRYFEQAPWRASFYLTAVLIGLLVAVQGPALQYGEVNATYLTLPLLALWLPVAVRDATTRRSVAVLPVLTVAVVGVVTFSRSVAYSSAGVLAALVVYGFLVGDLRNRWTVASLLGVALALAAATIAAPVPTDARIVVQTVGQGLQSPRFAFWADYLANFDLLDWLIGPGRELVDRFVRRAFTGVGNTLHNSVLQLHSHGGLVPALAVMLGWIVLYIRMIRLTRVPVHPALLVLAAKGSFDVIAFPQRFDIVYAVVLFAVLVRGIGSVRSENRGRVVFTTLGGDGEGRGTESRNGPTALLGIS